MNIAKVIENVRRKKAGYEISDEFIIRCINEVESFVILNVADGRENDVDISDKYAGYTVESDRERQLFLKAPYDKLYELYTCAEIDLEYEDTERYQNDLLSYNSLLDSFKKYYARTHRQNKKYNWHN